MNRHLTMAWWVGLALSALVLGLLQPTAAYDGGFPSVVMLAFIMSIAGVVPTCGLARRWLTSRDRRTPDWIAYLAAALVWSAALSLLTSVVLTGLPHGWDTAWSWSDIRLRTTWIAGVLAPAALGTHLVIRLWDRPRRPTRTADRPRPSERAADRPRPRTRVTDHPRPSKRGGRHR
ncbi:hypothetical protein [Streptomyces lutosisoli]|uniref:Integral membrane protein n=1 Tax=Streptomyces lutosisoli TaxID=2665721 RepID=A0ABW2VF73_9ACTN